jgi:hypothetical protein
MFAIGIGSRSAAQADATRMRIPPCVLPGYRGPALVRVTREPSAGGTVCTGALRRSADAESVGCGSLLVGGRVPRCFASPNRMGHAAAPRVVQRRSKHRHQLPAPSAARPAEGNAGCPDTSHSGGHLRMRGRRFFPGHPKSLQAKTAAWAHADCRPGDRPRAEFLPHPGEGAHRMQDTRTQSTVPWTPLRTRTQMGGC